MGEPLKSAKTFFAGRNISFDEVPDDIKQEIIDSLKGMEDYVKENKNGSN